MRTVRIPGVVLAGLIAFPASAQIPETFTNLQVLPKDIERRALIETMRGFSFSLGVRCEHCHVGGPDLETMSFAADDQEPKRIARKMLKMVEAINEEHLARLGRTGTVSVACFTCHRGVPRPEPIESIVGKVMESEGIEAGLAKYRELRKEHYGSPSYDFRENPLNRMGESLLDAGKAREAAAVLELNAEFNPESGWLQYLLGEAYLAAGEREKAKAALEKSLALLPENPRARARLEELTKPEGR